MVSRLSQVWQPLKESLWFVPGLMLLSAFLLAYGLVEFDVHTAWQGKKEFPLLFGVGAEGSRGMLSAIASSMLTVATLSFSLTLSTISQVSSQYSPRLLRNFMSDRLNQVVMGYFVGVFTYCLIVLGTIRGTDEQKFVPATAVVAGLALALGGVVALIFFIHHIAESLQSGTIIQRATKETLKAIATLFPSDLGHAVGKQPPETGRQAVGDGSVWYPISAKQPGYLQHIDIDRLLEWTTRYRVVVQIEPQLGDFIAQDQIVFNVCSDRTRPTPAAPDWPSNLLTYVSIGRHRSVAQDVSFGVQQLVDIALKALSPGINDTTTAIMAIDHLGSICEQLAKRPFPSSFRSDGEHLRVITPAVQFDRFIQLAFDLPRINADGNHAVLRRLLRALVLVGNHVCADDRRVVIKQQIQLLLTQADETLATAYEKKQVYSLYQELSQDWL